MESRPRSRRSSVLFSVPLACISLWVATAPACGGDEGSSRSIVPGIPDFDRDTLEQQMRGGLDAIVTVETLALGLATVMGSEHSDHLFHYTDTTGGAYPTGDVDSECALPSHPQNQEEGTCPKVIRCAGEKTVFDFDPNDTGVGCDAAWGIHYNGKITLARGGVVGSGQYTVQIDEFAVGQTEPVTIDGAVQLDVAVARRTATVSTTEVLTLTGPISGSLEVTEVEVSWTAQTVAIHGDARVTGTEGVELSASVEPSDPLTYDRPVSDCGCPQGGTLLASGSIPAIEQLLRTQGCPEVPDCNQEGASAQWLEQCHAWQAFCAGQASCSSHFTFAFASTCGLVDTSFAYGLGDVTFESVTIEHDEVIEQLCASTG